MSFEAKDKILIVDDEKFFRTILTDILSPRYHLIEAVDGKSALEKAMREKPNLVLLDMVLPDIDGNEVLVKLKTDEDTKNIPVIAITSKTGKDDITNSLNLGANDYITKPFENMELLARVNTNINVKKYADSLEKDKRDLSIIAEISEALSSSLKLDEILGLIVRKIAEVIEETVRCSIVKMPLGRDKLYVAVSHDSPELKNYEIDITKYPEIKKAFDTRKPLVIEDMQRDPLMSEIKEELTSVNFNSLMVLPIELKKDVMQVSLLLRTARAKPFTQREVNFCRILTITAANAIVNANLFKNLEIANKELEQLAITDGLTGLYNYRYFITRLGYEMNMTLRYGTPLSLIIIDIDNFKKINDLYGHSQGDEILKEVAEIIRYNSRVTDVSARYDRDKQPKTSISARYGGEEFVVLLPNTIKKNAFLQAERIRSIMEKSDMPGIDRKVTISLGVSSFPSKDINKLNNLMKAADSALYEAKRNGKNQTRIHKE